jgi:hypothetical protein
MVVQPVDDLGAVQQAGTAMALFLDVVLEAASQRRAVVDNQEVHWGLGSIHDILREQIAFLCCWEESHWTAKIPMGTGVSQIWELWARKRREASAEERCAIPVVGERAIRDLMDESRRASITQVVAGDAYEREVEIA